MLLLGKILYIEKKNFNIACQYLDIMDEYILFEYLLFNIQVLKNTYKYNARAYNKTFD